MNRSHLTGLLAATCVAAGAGLSTSSATADEELLMFHSAGAAELLSDERDHALRDALSMLDARLKELPRELDQPMAPPPQMVELLLDMLASPMTVRVGMLDPMEHDTPVSVRVAFEDPDPQRTREMADRFTAAAGMMAPFPSEPLEGHEGLMRMHTPQAPVIFGLHEAEGRTQFIIAFNEDEPVIEDIGRMDLPLDRDPLIGLRMDFEAAEPLFEMMIQQAGAQGQEVRRQFESSGLMGEHAMKIFAAVTRNDDHGTLAARIVNGASLYEEYGLFDVDPISEADVRAIPEDVTSVQISRVNGPAYGRYLEDLFGGISDVAGEAGPFDVIARETGIDLQRDVFDHLGHRLVYYTSMRSGGGGLTSLVGLMELSNEDGLSRTLERAETQLNALAREHARGYIRFQTRENDDLGRVTTLTFPGLPVPFELSYAITDGHLVSAVTPQGLRAGVAQLRANGPSLADRDDVMGLIGPYLGEAIQVQFCDAPFFARQGYGLSSLAMSGLANALRSPTDADRDPGVLMPAYHDVVDRAHHSVTVTTREGGDLVMTGVLDRSVVVNMATTMGLVRTYAALAAPAFAAGAALPAIGQPRESAFATRSSAQLAMIQTAVRTYAQRHNDRMPPDFDALLEGEYFTVHVLDSPLGDTGGPSDYWVNFQVERYGDADARGAILGYDRAAWLTGRSSIPVVFFDGRTREVSRQELLRLADDQHNRAYDLELGGW